MIRRHRAPVAAIGGIPILACVALVSQADAQGSMQSPVSRTYACALPPGGTWTFAYRATAPRGTFELYVTRDGYRPTQPLRWADLELFHTATDPALTDGRYRMTARLPQRAGRHLIYLIWQRSDSTEAFYTCSDVTFGAGRGSSAPAH
ncbi:lytic polysaccharide monooxygenase auxiliary activity family 9 protein [Micromonospora sp. RTP1Z1]|uniref:lytic polysaccharide monooxygenase auxiliary activity family 9 protein n=1 Tax=Micromonospora sp. RTP1Z1 TaxID=2994043 RepID=UPI0029C95724|nr:lytic polysaccharide monooxygenase auxiliary activity family 9 protein [Micromonospora sp. RTP1Z1]